MATTPPTTTTSEDCHVCQQPALRTKAGPGCRDCPAFKGSHYFPQGSGSSACDVVVLGDVPGFDRIHKLVKGDGSSFYHPAFEDDAGRVVRSAVNGVLRQPAFSRLQVKYLYAVKCGVDNPNKDTITACRTPLYEEFARIARDRTQTRAATQLTVIACGVTALRALGVAAHSFEEVQGRSFDVKFGDIAITVIVTMSLKAIAAATGKYSSVLADVERACRAATSTTVEIASRERLEQGYVYPRTVAEVRDLVDHIIAYSVNPQTPPEKSAISIDTETNTLHPHRDGTQLLMVSVSWDTGKSASIPLWHPLLHAKIERAVETVGEHGQTIREKGLGDPWVGPEYRAEDAWEHVKRLLACAKPKIFHNAGYDLKVFWKYSYDVNNVQWDDMLAEHALEEDKKGQYRLKFLTRMMLPQYSGYEDQLQERLEKEEGDDQTKSILANTAAEAGILDVPASVRAALDRMKLSPKFRAESLAKKLAEWQQDPDKHGHKIADAKLLLAAKAAGEFGVSKKQTSQKKKKEREGGFERIPLDVLSFYAAVDADVTRQLAVLQRKRMAEEQKDVDARRKIVSRDLAYRRGESPTAKVQILCSSREPLVALTKESYMPRMRRLASMEYHGITVDRTYLQEADAKLTIAIKEAEKAIYEMCGDEFKINAGPQLVRYLNSEGVGHRPLDPAVAAEKAARYPELVFWDGDRVRYAAISRTKPSSRNPYGQIQTTEAVLKTYAQQYGCKLSELVLAYKKATKAKGTFLKNVELLSRLDGRLHTRYNLNGTGTGRLSSSNMNMQNVPKGDLGGVKCKKLFVPDDDSFVFVNADAKGAEVAIFSAYSQDRALIEALQGGMDAHCFFSSKVLDPAKVGGHLTGEKRRLALQRAGIDEDHNWSYDDFFNRDEFIKKGLGPNGIDADGKRIKDETLWADPALVAYGDRMDSLRDNIKRVVFGILYGAGPAKIAAIAGIDETFARTIQDLLFGMFPTIPNFVELTKWELRTFGFVETYQGRRRRFALQKAPSKLMAQAERRAVNFKVQSSNSDIVLDVLCEINDVLERDLGGRMLLTVHDSLGFQVPKKYIRQIPDLMYEYGTKRVGMRCPWLPVPYKWTMDCGRSYGETMKIAKYLAINQAEIDRLIAQEAAQKRFEGYTEEEMYEDLKQAVLEPEEGAA